MRNPIYVLKSLESKSNAKGYGYERLYRNLYNPEFYLLAYKNIAKSQGSMTAGTDGITLDNMTMRRIKNIIASLKDHTYQPTPARRENIPKKNNPGKTRPLGIPSANDKLIQEVIRMILEAIYEPTFSKHSHGFRPNRSCHTALMEIQRKFHGVKWVIEGDIKGCFDNFDHHVLIDILKRRIKDEYFIALMWKFLKAGYMEHWKFYNTYSGTPQGSGMSPILANIYLSELDTFLEEYKQKFNTPDVTRKESSEYRSASYQCKRAREALLKAKSHPEAVGKFKNAQQLLLNIPCYPAIDPNFKRIKFNRYADDFVVGIIGSREDALKIKADIASFLNDKLKLTLSEEKTKVTHSGELIRYLGYEFTVSRSKDTRRREDGALQRRWYGTVQLYVPHEKWVQKLQEYKAFKIVLDKNGKENWKPMHRGILVNRTDSEIISKFNSEIRGIYNFYCLAVNVSVLNKFYFIMRDSMLKTLAAKFNTKRMKIIEKYTVDGVFGAYYDTKAGRKRCEFYHDGFKKQEEIKEQPQLDVLPQYRKYAKSNSLARRLQNGICEMRSAKTEEIHMHHVKCLKNLKGDNDFELLMMKKRRRSLALCTNCFEKTKTHYDLSKL